MTAKRTHTQDQSYPQEEAQQRFEAALRGARIVGHKEKKDISPVQRRKPEGKQQTPKGPRERP